MGWQEGVYKTGWVTSQRLALTVIWIGWDCLIKESWDLATMRQKSKRGKWERMGTWLEILSLKCTETGINNKNKDLRHAIVSYWYIQYSTIENIQHNPFNHISDRLGLQARFSKLEKSHWHSGKSDRNNKTLLCSLSPTPITPSPTPHSVLWPLSSLDQHGLPYCSHLMLFLSQRTL